MTLKDVIILLLKAGHSKDLSYLLERKVESVKPDPNMPSQLIVSFEGDSELKLDFKEQQ